MIVNPGQRSGIYWLDVKFQESSGVEISNVDCCYIIHTWRFIKLFLEDVVCPKVSQSVDLAVNVKLGVIYMYQEYC